MLTLLVLEELCSLMVCRFKKKKKKICTVILELLLFIEDVFLFVKQIYI